MGILKVTLLSVLLAVFGNAVQAQEWLKYEVGLKSIKRDVKGQDLNFYDTRPYIEVGYFQQQVDSDFTYGTSLNIAPNLTGSDIGNQLHWKVLDMSYELVDGHSFLMSAGALRNSKSDPAWGYSLGFGYELTVFSKQVSIHANWARTNTDIGGQGADTGAKDNMVWLDLGIQF